MNHAVPTGSYGKICGGEASPKTSLPQHLIEPP